MRAGAAASQTPLYSEGPNPFGLRVCRPSKHSAGRHRRPECKIQYGLCGFYYNSAILNESGRPKCKIQTPYYRAPCPSIVLFFGRRRRSVPL